MVKYNCEKCEKEFSRKLYLKQHLEENSCKIKSAKKIIEDDEKNTSLKKTKSKKKKLDKTSETNEEITNNETNKEIIEEVENITSQKKTKKKKLDKTSKTNEEITNNETNEEITNNEPNKESIEKLGDKSKTVVNLDKLTDKKNIYKFLTLSQKIFWNYFIN